MKVERNTNPDGMTTLFPLLREAKKKEEPKKKKEYKLGAGRLSDSHILMSEQFSPLLWNVMNNQPAIFRAKSNQGCSENFKDSVCSNAIKLFPVIDFNFHNLESFLIKLPKNPAMRHDPSN